MVSYLPFQICFIFFHAWTFYATLESRLLMPFETLLFFILIISNNSTTRQYYTDTFMYLSDTLIYEQQKYIGANTCAISDVLDGILSFGNVLTFTWTSQRRKCQFPHIVVRLNFQSLAPLLAFSTHYQFIYLVTCDRILKYVDSYLPLDFLFVTYHKAISWVMEML